jgi:peptide/nickel transport system substrate-binding protein
MMGWSVRGLFGVVALFSVVLAAGPTGAQPGSAITVVHGSEPRSLNPPIDIVKTTVNVVLTMFDTLVGVDEQVRLTPGLATEWRRTGDSVWRFTLRRGVKFHNGEEMDAASVVFSLNAYREAKGQATPFFNAIREARAIDKYTVDIVTTGPNAVIPELMSFLYVLPKGYYGQVGAAKFSLAPVGTGPFQFVEWVKGSHITVKQNPGYWKGAPSLSQITFRWAAEASTRVAMLESGQADLVVAVPAQMVDRIKASGNRVAQTQSLRKMFVELNIFRPPFDDVRVRRAVAHSIDVDELVQTVVAGSGVKAQHYLSKFFVSYNPALPIYGYDAEQAKRLLAQAGRAGGVTVPFYHTIGRYPLDREVATAIAGQLAKVGIKTELKGMETGTFFNLLSSGNMEGMHLLSIAPLYPHEDFNFRVQFHSKGLYAYGNSAEGDRMIDEAATFSDPQRRKTAYQNVEKYMMQDLVSLLPLYDFIDIYGVSKRLEWTPRPDEIADLRAASVK